MGTELQVARPTTLAMHAGRCAACRSEANILASSQSPASMQTSTQPLHCVCPSNRTNDWNTRSSPPLERQSMSRSRHGRRSYNVIPSCLAPQPGTCCQLPRHTPTNMTANTTSAVRQRPRNFQARAASNACAIGVAGKLPTSCHQHLRRSAARIRRVSCNSHRTAYAGPSGEEHCVGTARLPGQPGVFMGLGMRFQQTILTMYSTHLSQCANDSIIHISTLFASPDSAHFV